MSDLPLDQALAGMRYVNADPATVEELRAARGVQWLQRLAAERLPADATAVVRLHARRA